MKYLIFLSFLSLLIGCSNDAPSVELIVVGTTDALTQEQLFMDTIHRDSLHSASNTFFIDSLIACKPLNDSLFMVTNFTPMALHDVVISAQFEGVSTALKLLIIDSLPPHEQLTFYYPTHLGVSTFETVDGHVAELDPSEGIAVSAVVLDFLPTTEKLRQLKEITMHWKISFYDYAQAQPNHASWEPVRPAQARLYTALMMNAAYLFSQKEYKERFLTERFYKNVNDSTRVVEDSAWFTPEENSELYEKLRTRSFNLGIVSGGGLGGGSVLGVSNGTVTKQFTSKWDDSLETLDYFPSSYYTGPHPLLSHEIGHCLGYGHNSNVCSTGRMGPLGTPEWEKMYGFPSLSTLMHAKYMNLAAYPCMPTDYYLPNDFNYVQPAHGAPY